MEIRPHPYYFSPVKKTFDSCLALVLLICLSPLFLLVTLCILATANWPILYFQERLGQARRPFWIIKFRTMYTDASRDQMLLRDRNEAPYPMFKLHQDPRFIGCGKWLSQTGFDELPQLWNILRGEMSFVGPRPLPKSEAELLSKAWDFRYQVKPGIFSEWTASEKRHRSLNDWRHLEIATISKGGFIRSLLVIYATISSVLFKKIFTNLTSQKPPKIESVR